MTIELGDSTLSLPALGWMMPGPEMVDITSILSSMPISLSEPGPIDVGTSFETPTTVLKGMSCTFRNQLDTLGGGPEKEVWFLHNGGPLDVVSLLDLAKEGSVVRLLLNPREVHPSSPRK
ncbi:MAG: hypothetical protein MZV70_77205 [Desulfobacterales bacterium]|nr:hypothetical protein [Desulfobacterales bacterium]